jgi:hypothetical protein
MHKRAQQRVHASRSARTATGAHPDLKRFGEVLEVVNVGPETKKAIFKNIELALVFQRALLQVLRLRPPACVSQLYK